MDHFIDIEKSRTIGAKDKTKRKRRGTSGMNHTSALSTLMQNGVINPKGYTNSENGINYYSGSTHVATLSNKGKFTMRLDKFKDE